LALGPVGAAPHGVVDGQALHIEVLEAPPDVRVVVQADDGLALDLAQLGGISSYWLYSKGTP